MVTCLLRHCEGRATMSMHDEILAFVKTSVYVIMWCVFKHSCSVVCRIDAHTSSTLVACQHASTMSYKRLFAGCLQLCGMHR